jgi:polyphosphate kinase
MLSTSSPEKGETTEEIMSPKKSPEAMPPDDVHSLDDPRLYLNREINWIDFDSKVLDEAMDPSTPLLEQLKFLAIFFNNLDEFFMVRVSGLLEQYRNGVASLSPDGMSPSKQLALIRKKVLPLIAEAQEYWSKSLRPRLKNAGLRFVEYEDLSDKHKKFLEGYFKNEIYPILTPQAIDPGRPFPVISNLSLNFLVQLADPLKGGRFARLKIPKNLSRFIFLPRNKEAKSYESLGFSSNARQCDVLLVESLIAEHLHLLFPGLQVTASTTFRITRNTDVDIEEDESPDLLEAVRDLVDRRNFGEVVRLEVASGVPKDIFLFLVRNFHLAPFQIYKRKGPLAFSGMMDLYSVDRPDLKDEPLIPRIPAPFSERVSVYTVLRKHDVVLYHPYDSFVPVLDFVRRAATDPKVVAIKQTLYRVGNESPVVDALITARKNGKQVTAVVELKARFDEERNINWAEALEDVGVHVVYGLVGFKIHAKMCLVVRRESEGIRRYAHIGTGNYSPATAKTYADLGLFTSDKAICADVTDLFNAITGYSRKEDYRQLLVSPHNTRSGIVSRIEREISRHKESGGGCIAFKMNQLVDKECIQALYRASQAGVRIRLQVRGICCLRPGIPGISENIDVTSIVGRFLEHARIFYFRNGGEDEMFIGSADLMPRNLDRRVEVLVPVREKNLCKMLRTDLLDIHLADNIKSRRLLPDGGYSRIQPGPEEPGIDSQKIMTSRTAGWNPPEGGEET